MKTDELSLKASVISRLLVFFVGWCVCSGVAMAAPIEVPGNGIDDDGSGGDAACPSGDTDCDGQSAATDVDDTNFRVIVGTESTAGCAGGQYKTAQSDATYGSCGFSCPSGTCYHVRASGGSDSNAGTSYAAAFASLAKVSFGGSGTVQGSITCGDHIFLWDGTHDDMTAIDAPPFENVGILLRNKDCSSSNPITIHLFGTIDLPTTASDTASAIALDNVKNWVIKGGPSSRITGIHVSRNSGFGEGGLISIRGGSTTGEISGLQLDNVTGWDNMGAIYWNEGASNLNIHHNLIHTALNNGGTGTNLFNECLMMGFYGTSNRIHHNSFWYPDGSTLSCMFRYKHCDDNSTVQVDSNAFSNGAPLVSCTETPIVELNRVGTVSSRGNTASHTCNHDDVAAFMFCDSGGPAYEGVKTVRYNTVAEGHGFIWWPNGQGSPNTMNITNNIFRNNTSNYGSILGLGTVGTFDGNTGYATVITGGKLVEQNDCVYNAGAGTLSWCIYCGSPATTGSHPTFAQYQAGDTPNGRPANCVGCVNENPSLGTDWTPGNANCVPMGAFASTTTTTSSTTTTTVTTTTTTMPPGGAGSGGGRMMRFFRGSH